MLERALDRVSGRVSQALQQRAERRFPEMVETLMRLALEMWAGNNWHTFDQREVNCTAQLYRWLMEAKRGEVQFSHLNIELEYLNLTPAMFAGVESVVTALRPDLRLGIGQVGIQLECKRLLAGGTWCHDYVHKGMQRFVSSSYGANDPRGVMVGYVQQATSDGLLGSVNGFVLTHPLMGVSHQLRTTLTEPYGSSHLSSHVRPTDVTIDLRHVWVVLGET